MDRARLGDQVRRRREQLGLSRRALARALGLSPTTLAAIELGRRQAPRPETLAAISRVLQLTLLPDDHPDRPLLDSAVDLLHALPTHRLRFAFRLLLVIADQDIDEGS